MAENRGNRVQMNQNEGPYLNDEQIGNRNITAVKGRSYHFEAGGNHVREVQDENLYAGIEDSQQTSSEHPTASLTKKDKQRFQIAVSVIAVALLVPLGLSIGGIIFVSQEKLRVDKLQMKYDKYVEVLREQDLKINESLSQQLEMAVKALTDAFTETTPPPTVTEETTEGRIPTTTPLPTTAHETTEGRTTTPELTTMPDDGWTVFQRRQDGSVDFNRNWDEYVNGFGNEDGEFWMGLEKLHILTSSGNYELRIDLRDWDENSAYAEYSEFSVGSASTNYRLTVSGYSGTAGDSLVNSEFSGGIHNGMAFSAKDSDNDLRSVNCAELLKGGWWFNNCFSSNLNGVYHRGGKYTGRYYDGIVWYPWKNDWEYSMKFVEMKLRPAQQNRF